MGEEEGVVEDDVAICRIQGVRAPTGATNHHRPTVNNQPAYGARSTLTIEPRYQHARPTRTFLECSADTQILQTRGDRHEVTGRG